jgi:DnaK suppressor protein
MVNKSFLKKMKEKLITEKKAILEKPMVAKDIDLVDTDGDETDEIQGNLLIELQKQLTARKSEKILKIDLALDKIDLKTYGLCEDCGDVIPEKRLLINPYFVTCVGCAEDREIEGLQRKRN